MRMMQGYRVGGNSRLGVWRSEASSLNEGPKCPLDVAENGKRLNSFFAFSNFSILRSGLFFFFLLQLTSVPLGYYSKIIFKLKK